MHPTILCWVSLPKSYMHITIQVTLHSNKTLTRGGAFAALTAFIWLRGCDQPSRIGEIAGQTAAGAGACVAAAGAAAEGLDGSDFLPYVRARGTTRLVST